MIYQGKVGVKRRETFYSEWVIQFILHDHPG